jgi:ATP-dependent protease ClpP protease subunit
MKSRRYKFRNDLASTIIVPTIKCEHEVTDEAITLNFHDTIGDWWNESTSGSVSALLQANKGKPVNVSINSLGGYVFDGIGIYNLLAGHDGPVTTTVIGTAASAASIILVAGDRRRMMANSSAMIHRAWGLAIGNAGVMRAEANILDTVDQQIAESYAARADGTAEEWLEVMAGGKDEDGTWYSAKAALEAGLIDEIVPLKAKEEPEKKAKAKAAQAVREAVEASRKRLAAEAVAVRLRMLDLEEELA